MLLIWFVLSIVALTASNTVEKNRCDLSSRCENNSLSLPVKRSTVLRCSKRASCFPLDENLQYAVNQINKIYIHLKKVRIKQKKDGYEVQVKLNSYDDLVKQENQSLLVKFSFGRDDACYEFLIPSSALLSSQDLLLSCSRIPVLQRHLIFYFVHKETDGVTAIQAMNYSLSNVAIGQWLEGSLFRITYDLNDEFIYFSINATQELKCLFDYRISVYKSHEKHPCSINQTSVYHWSDTLHSPYHRLDMSRKLLSHTQKYCIYASFSKNQHCGTLHSKYFFYISFFQCDSTASGSTMSLTGTETAGIPSTTYSGATSSVGTTGRGGTALRRATTGAKETRTTGSPGTTFSEGRTGTMGSGGTLESTKTGTIDSAGTTGTVLLPFCEKWNITIDVKTNKNSYNRILILKENELIRKDIIATVTLWPKFSSCFNSYCLYMYKFNFPTCDADYGLVIPWKFKFEATPNKTETFNLPICSQEGGLLFSSEFNFEAGSNKAEVVFKNATIGYYCILVVPFLDDGSAKYGWSTDSDPIIVTETGVSNIKEFNKKDENPELGTKVIVAISFLLFFTAFALWSCSEHIRRSRSQPNQVISNEGEENQPLLMLPVDKVYIFYSPDDNSIRNEVPRLKRFLENGSPFSVITLSDALPEILDERDRAISNILECGCSGNGPSCTSNKRFIIIISERVLCNMVPRTFRYENHSVWRSREDRAFHMVLDFITANWREAYCHLFLVAFNESIFEDPRFESMALKNVAAHFTIPDCLERLCVKIGKTYMPGADVY